jgi:Ca2+-binding EF-hand superfamily protein
MQRVVIGTLLALAAGTALAQQQPAPSPQPGPAPSPGAKSPDPATNAKFKAADKNNNGVLDGTEVDEHKGKMTQIDTNKDGKISRDEFAAAAKAGHIR